MKSLSRLMAITRKEVRQYVWGQGEAPIATQLFARIVKGKFFSFS